MAFKLIDAQAALGFVLSQTSYIERQVNEVVYPDIQYPSLIPVDVSAMDWAKTVTYFSSDKFGQAKWINGNAGDIPMAGTEMAQHEISVYTAGIGYDYGLQEINQAAMIGRPLTADKAMAARRAYEEFVETVALTGDTSKGFYGLINNPTVTAGSATTGDWETATAAEIMADINSALISQATGTLFTSMANTIVMPYERYLRLATRQVDPANSLSILNWLLMNNAYTAQTGQPLMIRGMRGLLTAGAGGDARLVAYRKDPNVLRLHIPMPHRFLQPFQASPLRIEVPGIFRLGGLDICRPKDVIYLDGI